MEIKTIKSYQKEILAKYKREKGGELRGYLAEPTRSQIRDACAYLFHRRNEKNDDLILNRFFEFKKDVDKLREIQNFGDGKFRSIENFLKGEVENTSAKNLNLISWLIDFRPRPYEEYSKFDSSIPKEEPIDRSEPRITDEFNNNYGLKENQEEERKKQEEERGNLEEIKRKEEKKRRRRIITITISVAFGMTMLILGIQDWPLNILKNNSSGGDCMTWADSLYVRVSCDTGPFSIYETKVDSLDKTKLKNMRKVEVNPAYKFFSDANEPQIWYYKKNSKEIEYYTAPGLHPTNGETLRKITPYIIETYVPKHKNRKNSFVQ